MDNLTGSVLSHAYSRTATVVMATPSLFGLPKDRLSYCNSQLLLTRTFFGILGNKSGCDVVFQVKSHVREFSNEEAFHHVASVP